MTLAQLIYSKCFDEELQDRLLIISRTSNWVEGLIDFIGEYRQEINNKIKENKIKEDIKLNTVATVGGIQVQVDNNGGNNG